MTRLAKFIADSGYCSRRVACRLIEAGEVYVNDAPAKHTLRVSTEDRIVVRGEYLSRQAKQVYLLYNKPVGIDCVCNPDDPDSIVHPINSPVRVFPVGRLDKDSHGLMLLTNHGELCQRLMHPDNYHEKEYRVQVDREVTSEFCLKMSRGVSYGGVTTKPCKVHQSDTNEFYIVLTQGMNRQIRRMCEALGYRVTDLQRVRLTSLKLGKLPVGVYREPSRQELEELLDRNSRCDLT